MARSAESRKFLYNGHICGASFALSVGAVGTFGLDQPSGQRWAVWAAVMAVAAILYWAKAGRT